ncbi:ABC-2 type transport system permease protein [Acholeplasma morum]|uniref:ABC transporter permease n=1 Tax=Paracholeplasma morum TaxID=264637 RepID=UPI0019594EE9|nr:ABC-2 family transporter protein [Paracholeplasma morum]MBM7453567.1 ABC-2 type transport system permease protein [Paracholeplasma morum]
MKPRNIKKYMAFSKAGILSGFAYKFSAFGWLLGDIISLLILYFLWSAIYQNASGDVINGMTFKQMVSYLIYARVATSLVFASASFWIIGEDIYEGNIAISLIRPINYRYRLLAEGFGNFLSSLILMFIPLMTASIILLTITIGAPIPGVLDFVFFFISAILSFMIADSLNFLIGEVALFTNALFGLMIIKNITMSFFSGSLLPSSFFPVWLQNILNFLPFQSMVEKPIMILMGSLNGTELLKAFVIQLIWVLVLNMLCTLTFNGIKKRVVSVGG